MSNIFNALEQARRERHKEDLSSPESVGRGGNSFPEKVAPASGPATDAEIVGMFARIQEQLKEGGWVMQLISSQAGEGVSSVARRFAKVTSALLDKKVLLVKLSQGGVEQGAYLPSHLKWQHVFGVDEGDRCHEQNEGKFVEVLIEFDVCSKHLKQDPTAVSKLKANYDIIFFDMPSIANEPYGVELTQYADVVVIVLESERTKAFALQSLHEKIAHNSEALVGVVLNKRYLHIPSRLYSKLH